MQNIVDMFITMSNKDEGSSNFKIELSNSKTNTKIIVFQTLSRMKNNTTNELHLLYYNVTIYNQHYNKLFDFDYPFYQTNQTIQEYLTNYISQLIENNEKREIQMDVIREMTIEEYCKLFETDIMDIYIQTNKNKYGIFGKVIIEEFLFPFLHISKTPILK